MEQSGAKRQRVSTPTPKTLTLAVELAASIPDAHHPSDSDSAADLAQVSDSPNPKAVFQVPNYPIVMPIVLEPGIDTSTSNPTAFHPASDFTVSDLKKINDSFRLSLLLVDELIQDPDCCRALFQDPNYPKVMSLLKGEPDRSEFHQKRIGWWIQNDNLPQPRPFCSSNVSSKKLIPESGAKSQRVSTLTPKALALAVELAASIPDSAADLAQIDDSIRLSLLLVDELIQQSIRRRAVFREPNYPKVISLLVGEADRSEFHKKRIGWWIQNDNLPEESLKMIVHLKCDCGAEGCVYLYNDGEFIFKQDTITASRSEKFAYFATHCSCGSKVSSCGIFQDSDDVDYVKDVYAIWLLEHELGNSIQYPDCSNPREVFQEPSYPNVISLFGGEPVRSVFDEETIGWWIQKKDLPKDDLKMVVRLKCYCGVEGCVYWYNDGGFSWSQVTLSVVRSRMCVYFATLCSCGSRVSQCGIVREALPVDPAAPIPTAWSSYADLPAFNFKATDLALLNDADIFNVLLLLEGLYDPYEYDKITDVPHPNPKAVFCEPGYPRVITLGEDAPARSEFHNETIGWWIQKSELAEDLKMIVHLKCNCGAKGSVTWFNDGKFKLSQGDDKLSVILSRKDKISAVLSRKVAYFASSYMCGSHITDCGIARDKSIAISLYYERR
ncbi:hypothetical protein CCACVL1_28402 [Corchorus capsularis]|uniref:Uncharacterized protein n=1 Tax=Corchorus capsularis TaxID=210143 RepID=A0A1R3G6R2_COCAP|nr:hypothetical protein CCACVL1_28402 [Corchorus capsularis]